MSHTGASQVILKLVFPPCERPVFWLAAPHTQHVGEASVLSQLCDITLIQQLEKRAFVITVHAVTCGGERISNGFWLSRSTHLFKVSKIKVPPLPHISWEHTSPRTHRRIHRRETAKKNKMGAPPCGDTLHYNSNCYNTLSSWSCLIWASGATGDVMETRRTTFIMWLHPSTPTSTLHGQPAAPFPKSPWYSWYSWYVWVDEKLSCAGRSLKAELSEVYCRFLGYFYCGKALKRFLLSYFWGKNVFSKLNLLLSCRCTNSQSSLLLVERCDLISKCSSDSDSNLCSTLTGKWETSWPPRRSAVVPLLLDRVSFPIMLSVQD